MQFIQRLRMGGLLSFPPDMDFFELQPLNVLIGPNAAGKTNFIEVLELLRATPTDFAAAIRDGGGAQEWSWKGDYHQQPTIEVEIGAFSEIDQPLRYRLSFYTIGPRVNIIDETIEEATPPGVEPYFYYTFQRRHPVINIRVRTPDANTDVASSLREATKDTQKSYHKIRHAGDLLKRIDAKINKALRQYVQRFFVNGSEYAACE